jgi:hypothetical protein
MHPQEPLACCCLAGEYQEALALAALVGIDVDTKEASDQQMPQGDETQEKTQDSDVRTDALPNRLELEDRLRLLYGHHLYNSGEYEEGLAQLTLVSSHFLEGLHRQGTSTGSTSPTIRSNMGHQPSPAFGSQELGRALLLLRMVPGLVPLKYKDMLPTHAGTMQLPKVRTLQMNRFACICAHIRHRGCMVLVLPYLLAWACLPGDSNHWSWEMMFTSAL